MSLSLLNDISSQPNSFSHTRMYPLVKRSFQNILKTIPAPRTPDFLCSIFNLTLGVDLSSPPSRHPCHTPYLHHIRHPWDDIRLPGASHGTSRGTSRAIPYHIRNIIGHPIGPVGRPMGCRTSYYGTIWDVRMS